MARPCTFVMPPRQSLPSCGSIWHRASTTHSTTERKLLPNRAKKIKNRRFAAIGLTSLDSIVCFYWSATCRRGSLVKLSLGSSHRYAYHASAEYTKFIRFISCLVGRITMFIVTVSHEYANIHRPSGSPVERVRRFVVEESSVSRRLTVHWQGCDQTCMGRLI